MAVGLVSVMVRVDVPPDFTEEGEKAFATLILVRERLAEPAEVLDTPCVVVSPPMAIELV